MCWQRCLAPYEQAATPSSAQEGYLILILPEKEEKQYEELVKKLREEHSRVLVILDEEACQPTLRTPNWVYRGAEIKHYVGAVKPFL